MQKPVEIFVPNIPVINVSYDWQTLLTLERTGLFGRLRRIIASRYSADILQFKTTDADVVFEKDKWGQYALKEVFLDWNYHPLLHAGLEKVDGPFWTQIKFEDGSVHGDRSLVVWRQETGEKVLTVRHERGVAVG